MTARVRAGAVWGAWWGAAALALEAAAAVACALGYFDSPWEVLQLVALAALVGGGGGAVLGATVALAAPLWRRAPVWLLAGLAAAPLSFYCGWQAFAGPRAAAVPGRDLWRLALGVAGVALAAAAARAVQRRQAWRAWHAAALVALALGLWLADQRVLVRLYPWFHLGLQTAAAALLALAVWITRRDRAPGRRVALVPLLLLAAPVALLGLARSRALGAFALEHTPTLARLVRALPARPAVMAARPPSAASAAASAPSGPRLGDVDVALVTIDAWRADELGPATTPALARLAARGVRFTRAYTAVPHTSFSVASLLTGKYLYTQSRAPGATAKHQTLAAILRRERYKTAAFYPPSTFFVDRERLREFESSGYDFEYQKLEFLGARERTEQVFRFFADEQPARAFVWVHYLEPHEPYDAHPGVDAGDGSPRARYRGEVRLVDAEAARLVEWLERRPRRTLVVVAADHGEEFDEHGGRYHGTTLFEEQIRVPLFFAVVGGEPAPAAGGVGQGAVATPVSLVDVAPTLLDVLGVPRSLRMHGVSLGAALLPVRAEPPAHAIFAEIGHEKAMVRGDDKLICDFSADRCRLFNLAADAGERRPRAGADEREAELRAELSAWVDVQLRFEQPAGSALDRVHARATTGDARALTELGGFLRDPAQAPAAARLLLRFAPRSSERDAWLALAADRDEARAAWGRVGAARLGDADAAARLRAWVTRACGQAEPPRDPELCARAALALGDVAAMGAALEATSDHELALELIRALGASRDPRAYEPLRLALAPVRLRSAALAALVELRAPGTLPLLARWAPAEPYADVRRRMAEALPALSRDPAELRLARGALERLARDPDADVAAAVAAALAPLRPSLRREAMGEGGKLRPSLRREAMGEGGKLRPSLRREAMGEGGKLRPSLRREARGEGGKLQRTDSASQRR